MGNDAFTDRQFATAIDYFTRGIALDSTNHFLYSNRSAAFLCAAAFHAGYFIFHGGERERKIFLISPGALSAQVESAS